VSPVGLAAPPDGSGRLFILDQIGAVRIVDADGMLLPAPFLNLADRMVPLAVEGAFSYDERGLLGLAFHPDYATNGRFFVFYTAPKGADQPDEFDSESHISEFHVGADPNVGDPASEQVLLRIGKPQSNHNGGQLAFGPDGFLYISTGDGGGANDTGDGHNPAIGNGQDKTTLLAKILRIDVDSGSPYGLPPDNPFLADPTARPEIYALGTRNPWRFSFDSGGAHRLFVGDVGQDL
jgi:glucose/arabinose dehydrogenase